MRNLIIIAGMVAMWFASCAAQPRYSRHQFPPRHRDIVRTGAAVGAGVIIGEIIHDKLFTPRPGATVYGGGAYYEDPNLWHDRPGYPWYPRQIVNQPYYYYPTPHGNFGYYRGTQICMGVNLQQRVVIVCGDQTLSIWDAYTGGRLANVRLYAGYHSSLRLDTPNGARLVEIFFDGIVHVNYMTGSGDVLESFELF